jgi:gluconolactonase
MRIDFRFAVPVAVLLGLVGVSVLSADDAKKKEVTKVRAEKVEDLTLAVPESWARKPVSNNFRLAQFDIPNAEGEKEKTELVISSFGGAGGGVQANIDRWIQQFLPKGRTAKVTTGTAPQGEYIFVDVSGTFKKPIGPPIAGKFEELPDARMLGVMIHVKEKGTYFLKLAGPKKTVSAAAAGLRNTFGGVEKEEKEYKPGNAA